MKAILVTSLVLFTMAVSAQQGAPDAPTSAADEKTPVTGTIAKPTAAQKKKAKLSTGGKKATAKKAEKPAADQPVESK